MCTCASCKPTDSLAGWEKGKPGGFYAWPKGQPAGPGGSAREYSAHVAHGRKIWNEKGRLVVREFATFPNTDAASFYACKATPRAEVLRVLRQSFDLAPATVPEFIAAHPEIAAANAQSRRDNIPARIKRERKPAAVQPAPEFNIADLIERAIQLRGERAPEVKAA